jgi:hypothetical protein
MSLQEYLLDLLNVQACTPTLDEVLDRAGSRKGGTFSFDETVSLLREDRESH